MPHDHHYATHLIWTGAAQGPTSAYRAYSRDHTVQSAGKPLLHLTADAAFLGKPEQYNPEDLLLAALSGCHMLTYLALAARASLHVVGYEDKAEGRMVQKDTGGAFTEVMLRPEVIIAAGHDRDLALHLHHQAHEDCFIAASMNFPVRHEPVVTVAGA
ncbi:OsmC family protein [Dongia soli]|uniref:OsmC family protein n=1 Tax=Dongia soli TaxID=600628 RepID=A0ABU5EF70_9PROT|nr:OsmC family protein [Dongia soli]MDY0884659.1 OsmC family protein [Dongia soli]